MSRRENRTTPKVLSGTLYTDDAHNGITLDSPAWFAWLDSVSCFYYDSPSGTFTAHQERRQRGGSYWIAYRRSSGVLRRVHLGKAVQLTADCLKQAALTLKT